MVTNPLKKNKINLSDYPFERDIECRILMAELTVFEVDVLKEVIHGSLKMSVAQLASHLHVDEKQLLPTLKKLQQLKLYTFEGGKIVVDKERRKYYESQIPKFDNDFHPDLEFLRGLLSKVPIHVLPVWYAIPRTSDDIFGSIVEKYLLTPKIFQRYLDEVSFEEEFPHQLIKDLFSSPDYKLQAKELIKKYGLTREQFEAYMLLLEFNLVCCLSYTQVNEHWEETVTPFYEWRQLLLFQNNTQAPSITDTIGVKRTHPHDFGFVQDMTALLREAARTPLSLNFSDEGLTIAPKTAKKLFPQGQPDPAYLAKLVEVLQKLQLVEMKGSLLHLGSSAEAWLDKHLQEQAMSVYRYGGHPSAGTASGYIDRDLRETERCLKRVMGSGWIYFEDFLKGCSAPIGKNQPVSLIRKGKRWRYQLPEYNEEERAILHHYLFETLFQAGLVATGIHQGKQCFCVTPFGRMTLD